VRIVQGEDRLLKKEKQIQMFFHMTMQIHSSYPHLAALPESSFILPSTRQPLFLIPSHRSDNGNDQN
jgi:hypothetical protein